MNEILFFIQVLLIIGFALAALKLGKSALTAWVAVQALIANLFVLKQITLLGFDVTASDAFAIGSLLGLNFLQEYFSREDANRATWICFFFMVFFVLVSQIHLLYKPSPYDETQLAFVAILSASPRLLIASMSVFFVVQQIDIRFFSFLKKKLPQASFALRAAIALILSQFLDTFLFSFAGLYGIVASVADIIFISFIVKLVVIFCFTPFVRWAKA
ncbi:conserved putative membrane protein [Candidatus Protochlamydia naegleriophila]|uniref:Queuosine precursor transporter n=1 Tax=Candidatus Protochlamydia naegleriophila TaxID=389348 RepID=A0A0U5JC74_9BACT|nr:queuosine precursor transporter [Candidatus Protochlamydia naegleriophila]CUI17054.1 conserved putative membrane protein [Candidatus Protochlamydia naegleriophila]